MRGEVDEKGAATWWVGMDVVSNGLGWQLDWQLGTLTTLTTSTTSTTSTPSTP
ncbi:hypothetical protein PMIN01_13265 [Paraphaeosphaeria minitans]|uniref:Uncharacterized protein n=1 Tax=Paraphaeosphaeria minitans TaxID=565426 RepID=A0A9P6G6Q8_9PLEO|nr:hypothetical protein PMIN01_13265 [Paraphaeosphaeria minitans]